MECSICLEEIIENNLATTECGHTFHTNCLMNYGATVIANATSTIMCPICRNELVFIELEQNNDETNVVIEQPRRLNPKILTGVIVSISTITFILCIIIYQK